MRNAFSKLLLVLLATASVIVVTEAITRLVFHGFADEIVYLDRAFSRLLNSAVSFSPSSGNYSKKFGFVLSANSERTETTKEFTYTSRTNSLGFRAREIAPRTAGQYRVMLLGDSFFWGVGVENSETISSVMEDIGKPILSAYNFSTVGYNTVQELLVAQSYVKSLKPDHVILGFFIGNDIISNAITFVDENGNYAISGEWEGRIRSELRRSMGLLFHSVIFRIIALSVYIPRVRYQIAITDDVIAKSYERISELRQLAINSGSEFSVVIFYPQDSVQGGIVEAWSNSRKAGQLVYLYCQEKSIPVLDLIRYMNTPEHKSRYFYARDGHLNKEGNKLVAIAILNELLSPHISTLTTSNELLSGVPSKPSSH